MRVKETETGEILGEFVKLTSFEGITRVIVKSPEWVVPFEILLSRVTLTR